MVRDIDLYFETRLAFIDRPDARIRLADQPDGSIEIVVWEPIPANPGEPDHLKARPWIWLDPVALEPHLMRSRIITVVGRLAAGARFQPSRAASRPTAAALAAHLRAQWARETLEPLQPFGIYGHG